MDPLAIAVEIGGTKLQAALGSRDGEILARERAAAPAAGGATAILAWFETSIPVLLARAEHLNAPVIGIAIGFGGPIESSTGIALVSHQVGGWRDFPIKRHFESRFGLPVYAGNDSSVSCWGEYVRGAGKGTQTFCYMNIGSGIGGGLVVDGKLLDGQGYGAAEIGHTFIADWTSPAPGAIDKLENLCSGWSIEKHVRTTARLRPNTPLQRLCGGDPRRITCAMIGDAARDGDRFAIHTLGRVAQGIGTALANVIALVHPERIAIGGGVSLLGDVLLDPIREHVHDLCFSAFRDKYEIVPCALGEDIVLVGCLLLAPH